MPLPVLTVAQMRAWEAATWATGRTEAEVIRRVGQALADVILARTRSGDFVLLLAGRGHNGDDARAALPHLQSRPCHCLNVTDPAGQLPELMAHLQRRPALVVDALFGIGLNRPLDAAWQDFIRALNAAARPVLAVDVPSGLDADSGEPQGAAVQARTTVTVGAPKIGMLRQTAWPFVGRLEVATDVGLVDCPVAHTELSWVGPRDFSGFPPARPVAAHKGSFGHLAIVAGSEGFHGAAVLATHAAQRAQPGLVTLHTLAESYWPVAAQLQGAMVRPWEAEVNLTLTYSAVLLGPGLATPAAAEALSLVTRKLWRDMPTPLIVDASALDWLPSDPVPKGVTRVITPHPGEAARLLKTTKERIQADRPHALREISRHFSDCWVVLKGHETLIGRSTGEIAVNSSGNPQLAQGGSGDALAGYIAGLLAQPELQKDVGQTLRFAVWQHGATADQLSATRRNWVVEELVAALGNAG
jgi:NAD(P)H-hydrate epimerase